jgi:hypothetical protein
MYPQVAYSHQQTHKIAITDRREQDDRFGIANTLEQAKGMAAFCTLSQILPIYNKGWEPDWTDSTPKCCIETVGYDIRVYISAGMLA